jgi:hypothetical protein
MSEKFIVGAIETCSLPDIGIHELNVRIDTGAKTSSLHVDEVAHFRKKGKPWVSFDIHPNIHNVDEVVRCESPVRDIRRIKSSNGEVEERYIIRTPLTLGDQTWAIDISLTDRSEMSFLMLLGREGMGSKLLVDPSETYLLNQD